MNASRIRNERRVLAMVAPDSFPLIAERLQRLLPSGRRLAVAHSYATYTGHSPKVYAGLTVERITVATASLSVFCNPDFGFGVTFDERMGDRLEGDAWRRYHNGKHEGEAFSERRRYMTEVALTGGAEGSEPSNDDQIVIRKYNGDGVCDEKVIAFEQVSRS